MVVNTRAHQWEGMPLGMNYGVPAMEFWAGNARLQYGLDGLGVEPSDFNVVYDPGELPCCTGAEDYAVDACIACYGSDAGKVYGPQTAASTGTSLEDALSKILAGLQQQPGGSAAPNRIPTGAAAKKAEEQWIKGLPNTAVMILGFGVVAMVMINR